MTIFNIHSKFTVNDRQLIYKKIVSGMYFDGKYVNNSLNNYMN